MTPAFNTNIFPKCPLTQSDGTRSQKGGGKGRGDRSLLSFLCKDHPSLIWYISNREWRQSLHQQGFNYSTTLSPIPIKGKTAF